MAVVLLYIVVSSVNFVSAIFKSDLLLKLNVLKLVIIILVKRIPIVVSSANFVSAIVTSDFIIVKADFVGKM